MDSDLTNKNLTEHDKKTMCLDYVDTLYSCCEQERLIIQYKYILYHDHIRILAAWYEDKADEAMANKKIKSAKILLTLSMEYTNLYKDIDFLRTIIRGWKDFSLSERMAFYTIYEFYTVNMKKAYEKNMKDPINNKNYDNYVIFVEKMQKEVDKVKKVDANGNCTFPKKLTSQDKLEYINPITKITETVSVMNEI